MSNATIPGNEFRCHHCGGAVAAREILDGWCDGCGKRLPSSLQDALRRSGHPAKQPARDPEQPHDRPLIRWVVAAAVLTALLAGALILLVLTRAG